MLAKSSSGLILQPTLQRELSFSEETSAAGSLPVAQIQSTGALSGPSRLGEKEGEEPVPVVVSYRAYVERFDVRDEALPIAELFEKVKDTYHTHILNVGCGEAVAEIEKARVGRKPGSVSCSLAPHYLYFTSADIEDKDTRFKCRPPIRDEKNMASLLTSLAAGHIDTVASMHFPVASTLKEQCTNFLRAMPGANTLG